MVGVGAFYAMRSKVETMSNRQENIAEKVDEHSETLASHDEKIKQVPTRDFVDSTFVSKELFYLMEKHIEEHFTNLSKAVKELTEEVKRTRN